MEESLGYFRSLIDCHFGAELSRGITVFSSQSPLKGIRDNTWPLPLSGLDLYKTSLQSESQRLGRVGNMEMRLKVQLLCLSIYDLRWWTFAGRASSNTAQWAMTLYAAYPDTIISPPVIIALGSLVFAFGMLDLAIDLFFPPTEKPERSLSDQRIIVWRSSQNQLQESEYIV